jgi:transcriptional regulator with XRE-family HTH domain
MTQRPHPIWERTSPKRTIPATSIPARSIPETIGPLVTRRRSERGISQLRLAELLCATAGVNTVSRHEVSRWEREERIPTRYWLRWLALVLELPMERLEQATMAARQRRLVYELVNGSHWYEVSPGVYARIAA